MDDDFPQEIAVALEPNKDQTEIIVRLKAPFRMSTNDVCIELETLAHELSRADYQKSQPGISLH